MGMYTEIMVKADVNLTELSDCDRSVLDYMFGGGERPDVLPDHAFFKLPRWDYIGQCSSFYHHPKAVNSFDQSYGYIFSRSDLKNYDNEIAQFFNWFSPLTTAEPGKCIGYSWYEEDNVPTLIYKQVVLNVHS